MDQESLVNMNITLCHVTAQCAVLELDTATQYAAPSPFAVTLNGEAWGRFEQNCFTLVGLRPDHLYDLLVTFETGVTGHLTFRTLKEELRLDVTDFGARGNGETDCTAAIQAAIAACVPNGTVYLPAGNYLTGPLFLKSDMTFYLEKGATLLAQTDWSRYPVLPGMLFDENGQDRYNLGTWEGNPLDSYASLITAIRAHDLTICGEGTLDGNGAQGGWWQGYKTRRGAAWRPRTVFLSHCERVTLAGINVRNSPAWTVHPYYCTDINLLNINVWNPDDSPNTDGIDPECCVNVRIIGARISVGDDCISIKSGKRYMSCYHPRESRDILVRNCLLERGHGAVVVGSEISCGVSNVVVEQCLMRGTDRGLRVKTRRGRGRSSVIDRVFYRNIVMENVLTPFVINMFYFCDPDGKSAYVSEKSALLVDERTPRVGTLTVQDITCTGAQYAAMFFYGLPEQPIEMVEMKNVSVSFAAEAQKGYPAMMDGIEPMCRVGIFAANVAHIKLENVQLEGYEGEPVIRLGATILEEVSIHG